MNEKKAQGAKNLQIGLIVVAAILLLSIIGNVIYMTRSGRLADEKEQIVSEKEALEIEKEVLNEAIEVKDGIIEERNEKLEHLAEEHEALMAEKDARIAQLNRQVSVRASDLEEQKERNDELESKKEELEHEIERITDEIYALEQEMDALAAAYEQLEAKGEEAAMMNAYNINVLTKWDRWLCADRYNVSRARRVDETLIGFEVDGSVFTEAGTKTIHMLMYDPQDALMYPADETFEAAHVEGEEVLHSEASYTEMREIEYAHEPVMLEFNILHEDRLQTGPYRIEVYIDGRLTRTKVVTLE